MQIIPIASGKGGVGKSLVSANLAIALAQSGKRVVLVDLDLGASNLHLVLGNQSPKAGLGTFLTGNSDLSSLSESLRFDLGLFFLELKLFKELYEKIKLLFFSP